MITPIPAPSSWTVETMPLPVVQGRPIQLAGCEYLGAEEIGSEPSILIHPIPADVSVQLDHGWAMTPTKITIVDIAGHALNAPMATSTNSTTIDTRSLPNGIYVVHETIDGQAASARFIVMH